MVGRTGPKSLSFSHHIRCSNEGTLREGHALAALGWRVSGIDRRHPLRLRLRGAASTPSSFRQRYPVRPASKLWPVQVGLVAEELTKLRCRGFARSPQREAPDDEVEPIPQRPPDGGGQHRDRHSATTAEESTHADHHVADLVADPGLPPQPTTSNAVADHHQRAANRSRSRTARRAVRWTYRLDVWRALQRILDPQLGMTQDQSARTARPSTTGRRLRNLSFPSPFLGRRTTRRMPGCGTLRLHQIA